MSEQAKEPLERIADALERLVILHQQNEIRRLGEQIIKYGSLAEALGTLNGNFKEMLKKFNIELP